MCSEEFNLGDAMRLGAYVAAAKCGDVGARRALASGNHPEDARGTHSRRVVEAAVVHETCRSFSAAVVAGASALSLGIARPASANASATPRDWPNL